MLTLYTTGESAKAIFERAGLPNEVLGRIWGLSDREGKGSLDMTEFIIAMHLVTSYKARALTSLPSVLPPGLYEAAARRGAPAPPGSRGAAAPQSALPRQFTGPQRAQSPLARAPYAATPPPPMSAQTTGSWLITPQEKAKYDQFFNGVDTTGAGFLNGEQAVRFFSDSGLPEDTLAQIWDLADINSEGRLSRDEFAVAMYLIRQERSKPAGSASLPAFLPQALIPPSMRNQPRAIPQTTAPAFDNAANTSQLPKSAAENLFGLDASPPKPAAPAPIQTAQTTGPPPAFGMSLNKDGFSSNPSSPPPASPQRAFPPQPAAASSMFKPFMPSSAFGASLAAQHTGSSNASAQPQQQRAMPPPSSTMDDLLGEAPEAETKNINPDTTELANMSNQIGNLRNQMQEVQVKKDTHSRDVTAMTNQKRDLEQRLQQFRAQYEQEVRTVKTLEEQLTASRNDTLRLSQEFAAIQATHKDLSSQHQTVAQQLAADQQENATLKQRISQFNAEIAQLKPQVEKMRSDARQQRGMVAINKKQLSTNEGERDNLNGEMATLQTEAEERALFQQQHHEREQKLQERETLHQTREMQLQEIAKQHQDRERQLQERESQHQQELELHRQQVEQLQQHMIQHQHDTEQYQQLHQQHQQLQQQHQRLQQDHTALQQASPSQRALPQDHVQEQSREIISPQPKSGVISPALTGGSSTNPFFRGAGASTMSPGGTVTSPPASRAFDDLFGPAFSSPQQSESTAAPSTSFRANEPALSGQSVSSEGRPTPSATPPLSTNDQEVPPVPESRQFTPGLLPMRNLQREASFDSSVRAAAPESVADDGSVAAAPVTSPFGSSLASPFDGKNAYDNPSFGHEGATTPPAQVSGPAFQELNPTDSQSRELGEDHEPLHEAEEHMPGAFPEDTTTPMTTQITDPSQADDFESAFAGFGESAQSKGKAPADDAFEPATAQEPHAASRGVNSEFPAIRELAHDDDSDSDSDRGFDDDFSAGPSAGNGAPLEPVMSSHIEHAHPEDARNVTDLPPITAQTSPPSYEDTVPHRSGSNGNVPPEFQNLLPSREDPTNDITPHSVPEAVSRNLTTAGSDGYHGVGSGITSEFTDVGAESAASITTAALPPVTSHATSNEFDDFADFDDLSEAQEATGETSGFGNDSEIRGDEFNPTFDSPGHFSPTYFNNSTASPESTPVTQRSQFSAAPANGFGGFGTSSYAQMPIASPFGGTQPAETSGSHDWDAIFSGLDSNPAVTTNPVGDSPAFDTTARGTTTSPTTWSGISSQPGAPVFPNDRNKDIFGGGASNAFSSPTESTFAGANNSTFGSTSAGASAGAAPSASTSTNLKPEKPVLGRAITTTGEHDDPTVKRLTGMGFSRDKAVKALEDCDYNVDRVC